MSTPEVREVALLFEPLAPVGGALLASSMSMS